LIEIHNKDPDGIQLKSTLTLFIGTFVGVETIIPAVFVIIAELKSDGN